MSPFPANWGSEAEDQAPAHRAPRTGEVSVQQDSIERIRSATFSIARRGYDKREVEAFLDRLADWLEGSGEEETRSDLVRRELERVGESTAGILAAAHDAAQRMRLEAQAAVEGLLEESRREAMRIRVGAEESEAEGREEVERYAEETRRDADTHAKLAREEADRYAAEVREEADAEARRLVEAAEERRRDIETVISDLSQRRDAVLAEIRRLTGELTSAVGAHRASEPTPEPGPGGDEEASEARAKG